jgi:hypothetical protein
MATRNPEYQFYKAKLRTPRGVSQFPTLGETPLSHVLLYDPLEVAEICGDYFAL